MLEECPSRRREVFKSSGTGKHHSHDRMEHLIACHRSSAHSSSLWPRKAESRSINASILNLAALLESLDMGLGAVLTLEPSTVVRPRMTQLSLQAAHDTVVWLFSRDAGVMHMIHGPTAAT